MADLKGDTTNGLIHSATETIRKSIDDAERNLKDLTKDRSNKDSAVEASRAQFEELRRATGTAPEVQRIPKNCDLGTDYRSRPSVHLDWIITTDPSKPRTAENAPEFERNEDEGVAESEWIFDTKGGSEEFEEYEEECAGPPVVQTSRPEMDLEWILSTRPSQAAMTKLVEPGDKVRKVPESEWIFRTDPDFFAVERPDEEMYFLDEIVDMVSQLSDDNLLRTANLMSDRSLATAHLLSDRVAATPVEELETARSLA
ncbi:hypothetical protein Aduo_017240 [Ancylostoma duodenale]